MGDRHGTGDAAASLGRAEQHMSNPRAAAESPPSGPYDHGGVPAMFKRAMLIALLGAGTAWAQQDVAINGTDLQSGAANGRLTEVGKSAAAAGKVVVVNAPQAWHAQIAAKLRAAGATNIRFNDSFFENVVLRLEDNKPVAKVEPAPVAAMPAPVAAVRAEAKPEPVATPKPVAKPEPAAAAPVPKPAPVAAPAPAPTANPAPAAATIAEPAPVPAPTSTPAVTQPAPEPVATPPAASPAPAEVESGSETGEAIRKRFETNLNEGRTAEGGLGVEQLQAGDLIYVDGPVRAVVHRERLGTRLYWLEGELNLQRAELKPLAANRYEVIERINLAANVSLRADASTAPQVFAAAVPAGTDAERAEMEKKYGEGRAIARTLRTSQLRQGDVLFVGAHSIVVVRREGTMFLRYWLDGSVDLNQRALQKDGATKYRVQSDKVD